MRPIEELIKDLPPDLHREVEDFIEFLLKKRAHKPRGIPSFEWAGALRDMRDQYTSVDLQHKIAEWRIGGQ